MHTNPREIMHNLRCPSSAREKRGAYFVIGNLEENQLARSKRVK